MVDMVAGMTEEKRRGLSPGCILVLVPVVLVALAVLVPLGSFAWSVVQMNLHREDFAAFDRIPPGTPVAEVVKRAEDLGFEREPLIGGGTDAGDQLSFEKVVVPPSGRWFINVISVDGGVVSVRTSTLD